MIKNWRYYVGVTLFIIHLILPILALFVVPVLGLSAGVSSIIYGISVVGGPDMLLIIAVAFLGKESLQNLFTKLGSWLGRLIKWEHVSPFRYTTGLLMMGSSIFISFVLFYFLPGSLRNGDTLGWGYYVTVCADILFTISFFVLGAEFGAKVKALFQYDTVVVKSDSHL